MEINMEILADGFRRSRPSETFETSLTWDYMCSICAHDSGNMMARGYAGWSRLEPILAERLHVHCSFCGRDIKIGTL